MWFLLYPFSFFENKTSIPFVSGFIGVFFDGGLALLTALTGVFWMSLGGSNALGTGFEIINLDVLSYTFLSSFVFWLGISTLVYAFFIWDSEYTTDYFTVISMCGLGFVPLSIASLFEFGATVVLAFQQPPQQDIATTHMLIAGEFSSITAVAVFSIHIASIVWCVCIWAAGVNKLGGVSLWKSTVLSAVIGAFLVVELSYVSTM